MGARTVLAVLLLFTVTVKAQDGGVTFWGKEFTMKCPGYGIWYNKTTNITSVEKDKITFTYDNSMKGTYYCEYGSDTNTIKYYFYVQGKVCEHCYEVDGMLFWMAVALDVAGTVLVMMIIYRRTKQKSSNGLTPTSKPPARQGARAPPVPSPDYAPLNPRTVSQDAYSVVNRMG